MFELQTDALATNALKIILQSKYYSDVLTCYFKFDTTGRANLILRDHLQSINDTSIKLLTKIKAPFDWMLKMFSLICYLQLEVRACL